jgi:hypothetical protein
MIRDISNAAATLLSIHGIANVTRKAMRVI